MKPKRSAKPSDRKHPNGLAHRVEVEPPSDEASESLEVSRASEGAKKGGIRGEALRRFAYRYGVIIALLLIPLFFSILLPRTYFTLANLRAILSTQAVLVVVSLGLTIALVVNEFDLSVGAVLGWSSMLLVMLVQSGVPLAVAFIIVIVSGILIGALNAVMVVRFGVHSFIATLGMATLFSGLSLLISSSTIHTGVPSFLLNAVSRTKVGGISLAVFYAFIGTAVLWYVLDHTPLGRHLYFTGFGREAARLSGIRVGRLRFGALVASALIASIAGLMLAGTLGGADPTQGNAYMLPAFSAAYLGSTMLKPGKFNAWGTLIAVYLLISGITGLTLAGLSGWVEQVFNGVALLAAVTFARIASRRTNVS